MPGEKTFAEERSGKPRVGGRRLRAFVPEGKGRSRRGGCDGNGQSWEGAQGGSELIPAAGRREADVGGHSNGPLPEATGSGLRH